MLFADPQATCAELRGDVRRPAGGTRARAPHARPLWLAAIPAQSGAEALAASGRSADAGAVGRGGQVCQAVLRTIAGLGAARRRADAHSGAGHYPEIEQSEATIRAIDAFVRRVKERVKMKVWHFSELAYYPAWEELGAQLRNVVPSRLCDPKVAADLYHRGLDEWALCDELGLNIMVNEHHATATCIDSVCTIPMAILARETKKARLLCLGMPIGNRFDAVRVAEEYSMLDVISRGRVEMGFVKGAPFEVTPANSNPADLMTRFWEAHDLILKAMTTHDGPFNWEGRYYPVPSGQRLAAPLSATASPGLADREQPRVRADRRRARLCHRFPQYRLCPDSGDLCRLPQGCGEPGPRSDARPVRLHGDRGRRLDQGGRLPARRPDPRLQPHGAARRRPVRLSARLSVGRRDGAGAEIARLRLRRRPCAA